MKKKVFISYSHQDLALITKIVELLKITRSDLVFQDSQDIKPGEKWEPKILEAIDQSKLFIIFWCRHSKESTYVQKEYERALAQDKDILPVLIDNSPLIEPLSAYQWLDFQEKVVHETDNMLLKKKNTFMWPMFIGLVSCLFFLFSQILESPKEENLSSRAPNPSPRYDTLSISDTLYSDSKEDSLSIASDSLLTKQGTSKPTKILVKQLLNPLSTLLFILFFLAIVLVVYLMIHSFRSKKDRRYSPDYSKKPSIRMDHLIINYLESELLKRIPPDK